MFSFPHSIGVKLMQVIMLFAVGMYVYFSIRVEWVEL